MKKRESIRQDILKTIPRLLTQLDRDPLSPTYGCFDRNFWHYKIRDFPSFILQQNTLTLTLLYKYSFQGNFCYQNQNILNYIKASIDFWCKYQHKSGGFDEYWPNEDGYPPLVFSFYAVTRSYRELGLKNKKYLEHFDLAYQRWLVYTERQAFNQEMAGLAGVYQYCLITSKKSVKKNFDIRLKQILKCQSKEGWFPEYGGADIGYSSVLLHFFSDIYEHTKDKRLEKVIKKLVDFLSYFIHPDGSMGGEYGSRNTEYFLLDGLVRVSRYSSKAVEMLEKIDWSLDKFDDRYLFHYVFMSCVEGYLNLEKTILKNTKIKRASYQRYFKESGLFVRQDKSLYFVANLKKGGVYKAYKGEKLVSQSGGYRVSDKRNKYLVSAWIDGDSKIKVKKNEISLKTKFYKNSFFVSEPIKHIALRVASFLFSSKLISGLKKILIFQDNKTDYIFKRKFVFEKNAIQIVDQIDKRLQTREIFHFSNGAMRYVPSTNFFNKISIDLSQADRINIDNGGIIGFSVLLNK